MKYENLYDDFIKLFPEDKEYFEQLEEENDIERDTMHLMFGMIVCPFLHKIVEEEPEKAKVAFEFIEQMETCGDDEIANVADVSVIEIIMTDENGGLEKFKEYLGNKTAESVIYMSQFFSFKE